MLELNIVPVRKQYQVEDKKQRTIYTIKRKWGKYAISDANGYELYVLADSKDNYEPEYSILLNNKRKGSVRCVSKFVHPRLELKADGLKLTLATEDHMHYTITNDRNEERGSFTVIPVSGGFRFELQIEQVDFDDYIPLVPLAAIQAIAPIT